MNDYWTYSGQLGRIEPTDHNMDWWTGKPDRYITIEESEGTHWLVVRGVVPAGYDNVDYEEWYPLELVEQLIRDSRNANTATYVSSSASRIYLA